LLRVCEDVPPVGSPRSEAEPRDAIGPEVAWARTAGGKDAAGVQTRQTYPNFQ